MDYLFLFFSFLFWMNGYSAFMTIELFTDFFVFSFVFIYKKSKLFYGEILKTLWDLSLFFVWYYCSFFFFCLTRFYYCFVEDQKVVGFFSKSFLFFKMNIYIFLVVGGWSIDHTEDPVVLIIMKYPGYRDKNFQGQVVNLWSFDYPGIKDDWYFYEWKRTHEKNQNLTR